MRVIGARRGLAVVAAGLLAALASAAPAAAQSLAPYSGKLAFKCDLQYAGTGGAGADTAADPYCVEFDKTNQTVTDFGLVDFLAAEPPRFTNAGPKCFYHQRDHWTGSIQQGGEPALWHWDGNYFFDKARSTGGVNFANAALGGVPMDGSRYAPEEYRDYYEEGGGGNLFIGFDQPGDPRCVALVDTAKERRQTYRPWYRRALRAAQ